MGDEGRIAELEAAIARWAKQVDELEAERDLLRRELHELRKLCGDRDSSRADKSGA